jgi:acyl carrier protein
MTSYNPSDPFEATVLRLLREVIPWQIAKKEISLDSSLQHELGIDSLGKVSLAFRLEESCDLDLSAFADELADIRTVKDVLDVVRRLRKVGQTA